MATPIQSLYIDPQTLYVGIGTQRPQARLTVAGHICPSTTLTYDLGTSNLRFRDLYLSGNTLNLGGTSISRDPTTGGLKVMDPASGNAPLDMTVRNLTASNVSVLGDYVTLNTITSNTEQMVVTNAGTGPALQVTQTGPQPIADFYDDNNALALRIANGGNVGIGMTNPEAKLHVNGDIMLDGSLRATNTPGFSVSHNGDSDYVLPANTNFPPSGKVAVLFNIGNHFNTNTRIFTVPITGRYLLWCYFYTNEVNSTSGRRIFFIKNGSSISQVGQYTSQCSGYSIIEQCTVNDTLACSGNSFGFSYYGSAIHNGWGAQLLG